MVIDGHYHLLLDAGFPSATLRDMDSLGVEKTLLLALPSKQWRFMGHWCAGNEDVLKAVRCHPDRFVGSVYLDPRDRDAIDTLRKYADAGFRSAKLHPVVGYYVDQPEFFELYARLDEMSWTVTVHAGLTNLPYADGSGRTTHSKYADPVHLDGVVRLFPRVMWIIAHMGWPHFDMAFGMCAFNENVYMDLSGPMAVHLGLVKIAREKQLELAGVNLASKMVWGSDCIDMVGSFRATREWLERMGCDRYRGDVLGETMKRLLKL